MSETILYDYWRSSASYRLRIALNLLGVSYRAVSVDLLAGEQKSPEHLARNPQGLVPVLEIDGLRLTQSLAILTYLNDTRSAGWMPADPGARAQIEALAQAIAMDIHPICNSGTVAYVAQITGGKENVREDWMARFIRPGLEAFETLLGGFEQAPYCCGDTPGLADICLLPQVYNARRWGVEIDDLPRIMGVVAACEAHPAFVAAYPENVQP